MKTFSSRIMAKLVRGINQNKSDEIPGFGDLVNGIESTGSFNVAARSEHGIRNSRNEDAYLALPDLGIFAVSDGMGGYNGGRVASHLLINTLYDELMLIEQPLDTALIQLLINKANRRIYEYSRSNINLKNMGCTLILTWIHDTELFTFHVGDSRAYRLRNYQLECLTTDHSPMKQDSVNIADKPTITNSITRALGISTNVQIELNQFNWKEEDQLMLLTDGITDVLQDYQLANILVEQKNIQDAAKNLLTHATASHGEDDKTVLIIEHIINLHKKG